MDNTNAIVQENNEIQNAVSLFRYALVLQYNGTKYHGWQVQLNSETIQGVLERSFSNVLRRETKIYGCGRTDTGVHARHFVANFEAVDMDEQELEELVRKMNAYLPNDIRIFKIKKMDYAFNARFDAVSRTYKYYIATQKQPYNEDFCLLYTGELDVEKMNRAAARMYEYSDFASFTTAELGEVNNFRCNLMLAYWKKEGDYLVFTIKANRFLRNMVRCVVGTLLAVGKGTITEDDFVRIIKAKDRKQAMSSALAKGLFLENIEYKDLDLQR